MLKNVIRKLLRRSGWELSRLTVPAERSDSGKWREKDFDKWRFLQAYSPETILDIGANRGQFARVARAICPSARIISFEPLPECVTDLEQRRSELEPFDILPYALGDDNASVKMFRNQFSPSSSLLEMKSLHHEELPHTAEVQSEVIQMRRLDDCQRELAWSGRTVIKIDVQGYSAPVLRGGEQVVRAAEALIVEISMKPLYEKEATFDEIWRLLSSWGFSYAGNVDQWKSSKDGRILQCDCLFENRSYSSKVS